MSRLFLLILSTWLLSAVPTLAQVKWDGEGNDGRWENILNWSPDILPGPDDEVLLDHSFVPVRYTVELPAELVRVRSILIDPGEGDTIELRLPATSLATPSLVITGVPYGLTIHRKGVFRNLSGATAGAALSIADSIRINNGGKFVHASASGHASLVEVLSAAPGTERGVLEFDSPNASTTLSFSGRVFGTLVLRSATRSMPLNYTAAGTRPVQIRGNLELEDGVHLNLNFSDTIFVAGDVHQGDGTLDLGTTARSVVLAVKGNILQEPRGLLTETGTGAPVLLLNGDADQQIRLSGGLTEAVTLEKNGAGAAILLSPLSIGHSLRLKKGVLISSAAAPLVLLAGSGVEVDSLGAGGFVQGPVRREALVDESFLFPVGGNGVMRWLALEQATGSFTVEYHRADPYLLSSTMGEGLHHVSHLEYWELSVEEPLLSQALLKLSFYDPNSGGVTAMEQLRAGRLEQGVWQDAGTVAFAGAPGADGWVSVGPVKGLAAEANFFALASASGWENPLPLTDILLKGRRGNNGVELTWECPPSFSIRAFEIQVSGDNRHFFTVSVLPASVDRERYQYTHTTESGSWYYRVLGRAYGGSTRYVSRVIRVPESRHANTVLKSAVIANHMLKVKFTADQPRALVLVLYATSGVPVKKMAIKIPAGASTRQIPLPPMPAGIYFLREYQAGRPTSVHRLLNR